MSATGVADATAFLTRLLRLDPAAPVRVVPGSLGPPDPGPADPEPAGGRMALWASLPWEILVTRVVDAQWPAGEYAAGALLAALGSAPAPADLADARAGAGEWRWGLPPGAGTAIEQIPAREIHRVGMAAEQTLRTVTQSGIDGRAVGQRAVRDALLDHVPITVEAAGQRVGVPQRLVQAVVRMGFLGAVPTASVVLVRVQPGWVGLAADYGTAWWHRVSRFTVTPVSSGPRRH